MDKIKFEFRTAEDAARIKEKVISELTDDKKTNIMFNGNLFYELGKCHDFLYGYFFEYITKNGIEAKHYVYSNQWLINDKWYDYTNNKFVIIEKAINNVTEPNFNTIPFPKIKNINFSPIADTLISVKPLK